MYNIYIARYHRNKSNTSDKVRIPGPKIVLKKNYHKRIHVSMYMCNRVLYQIKALYKKYYIINNIINFITTIISI